MTHYSASTQRTHRSLNPTLRFSRPYSPFGIVVRLVRKTSMTSACGQSSDATKPVFAGRCRYVAVRDEPFHELEPVNKEVLPLMPELFRLAAPGGQWIREFRQDSLGGKKRRVGAARLNYESDLWNPKVESRAVAVAEESRMVAVLKRIPALKARDTTSEPTTEEPFRFNPSEPLLLKRLKKDQAG